MKEKILNYLKIAFESFLWISLLVFAFDVVTKQIVLHNMTVGQTIPEKTGFMYWQYVINDGMAFGLSFNSNEKTMIANRIIFISISVIGAIILFFIFFKFYQKLNKLVKISLALMIAGCLGNLVDRVFYSQSYLQMFDPNAGTYGVVDFIAVDFGSYSFPRFNIADSALVIGALFLIVYLISEEVKDFKARRKAELKEMGNNKVQSLDEKMMEENNKEVPAQEPAQEEKKENGEDL